jgi:itaconyl-CoA hydratase
MELYDRWWEDFSEGTAFQTRGVTVTETHVVNWASLAGDWLPFHMDREYAAGTPFGQRIAHGPLTLALSLGLVVQTGVFGDAIVAWLGLEDVRAVAPVLLGDTIRVVAEVVEHVPTSKPGQGRLHLGYTVCNQRDETVMTYRSVFLMRRKQEA